MRKASLRLNAAFNAAGLSAELVGTAVLVPYVLAKLGVEAYGLITSVISLAIISQMLAQSALVVAIRQVAALRGAAGGAVPLSLELRVTRASSIGLLGLSGLGIAMVLAFESQLLSWLGVVGELRFEGRRSLHLLCWTLPFMVNGSIFPAILRGREQFGVANGLKAASVVVRVAAVFVAFELGDASVASFVLIRCASAALEGLASGIAVFAGRRRDALPVQVDLPVEPKGMLLGESGVLLSYAVGNLLVLEVSKLLVGGLFDLEALGVFGAASVAASLIARLGQAVASVFTPAISGLEGGGKSNQSARLMKRGTSWTALILAGGTVCTLPAWKGIASIWLGETLASSWLVLGVVFAGQGLVSAVSPAVFSAYGRGKVLGVSLIHLGFNALSLGIAVISSRFGGVDLLGFVLILAVFRGLGAAINFAWVAIRVFNLQRGGFVASVIGAMAYASMLAALSAWLASSDRVGPIASLGIATLSLGAFATIAWRASQGPSTKLESRDA